MKSSDRKINKKISPFVSKLLKILEDSQNHKCMKWASPSIFMVADCDELSQHVLKKYFKHSNFSSFIRQLNIYGFQKVKTQQNYHFYQHTNFIQNNRRQLKLIQRKSKKSGPMDNNNTQADASESIEVELVIQRLKKQNEQIQKQNKKLHEQIKKIQEGNKSQMQKVLNFLSDLARRPQEVSMARDENFKHKQTLYQNLQNLFKKQLENSHESQKTSGKVDFDSFFTLLRSVLPNGTKAEVMQEENNEEIKEDEISNMYNISLTELNHPIFPESSRIDCGDLNQYGVMEDFF